MVTNLAQAVGGPNRNEEDPSNLNNNPDEVFSNLKAFLQYLEKKKIINITEVVQDKDQVNALIQDIMKLDLNKFNESRQ